MGYCTDSAPRNGPYNSFKSPLLQQQKPEEQAKSEENPIDPRLKNIGRAHDMFSQIFGTRIYEFFPSKTLRNICFDFLKLRKKCLFFYQ